MTVPHATDRPTPRHDRALHPRDPSQDELLIARHVADDVDAAERALAERLVAGCAGCAALAADLRAISSATRRLPAPRRPRDFRLSAADAAALRPLGRSPLARLRSWLAGPGFAFSRPLAGGLVSLGLVGLVLSSSLGSSSLSQGTSILSTVGNSIGGQAAAPAERAAGSGAYREPAAPSAAGAGNDSMAGASAAPSAASSGVPSAAPAFNGVPTAGPAASGAGSGTAGSVKTTDEPKLSPGQAASQGASSGLPPLPILSLAAVAAGIALLLLRWGAGRSGG